MALIEAGSGGLMSIGVALSDVALPDRDRSDDPAGADVLPVGAGRQRAWRPVSRRNMVAVASLLAVLAITASGCTPGAGAGPDGGTASLPTLPGLQPGIQGIRTATAPPPTQHFRPVPDRRAAPPPSASLADPATRSAAPRPQGGTSPAKPTVLLSQGHPATASSVEGYPWAPDNAVDGNTGTRWSSAWSDPQWLEVDLGATRTLRQVVLDWENPAYATGFQIQVSGNGTMWTSIYSTTAGTGGVQAIPVSGKGRYVRMYGTHRATGYGYSLWEFQVYGS
jgi:hypothetical protein